ncbi:MAG: diadenylate cyclase [Christensenellaceae bacterium]
MLLYLDKLAESFKNLTFHPVYILEFILYFIFITFAFTVLKNNNAKKVIWFYCVFTVLIGVVLLLSHEINPAFNGGIVMLCLQIAFVIVVVLLFATEVKRVIWDKRNSSDSRHRSGSHSGVDVNIYIDEIIKAVQNMSKNDVGAIIILSNGNLPNDVLESGVILNADISSQLIESVFFPKTALHDGAMVLSGNKIQAAGCFLQPTQGGNISKELGSRHRAGIGITEMVNVTTIIVSEETGIISIAKGGKILRYVDSNTLRSTLKQFFWQDLGD